jgi:hypothetical protein
MLIGRLEDTFTEPMDGGRGQLARLAVKPEDVADKVDGFKTLVKLDPDHDASWKKNQEWLQDVFERCCKLEKPLFNETLIFQREGAHIVCELPISMVHAALGAQVDVPTLKGVVKMSVPAGTQSGRLFRLKGKDVVPPHPLRLEESFLRGEDQLPRVEAAPRLQRTHLYRRD